MKTRRFTFEGVNCAEEVSVFTREIGRLAGDEDRLDFAIEKEMGQ